jgi:hypothetical protein
MGLQPLFQRMRDELRTTLEELDGKFVLPFDSRDVLRHCVLAYENPQDENALNEIRNARIIAWNWATKTPKAKSSQTQVIVLKHASPTRSDATESDDATEESSSTPSLKALSRCRTAREVADAIEGDAECAGNLKKTWDKRRAFYPKPKGKKGKQANLYVPDELLGCALRNFDVREQDLPKIRRVLGLKSPRKQPRPPAKSKAQP